MNYYYDSLVAFRALFTTVLEASCLSPIFAPLSLALFDDKVSGVYSLHLCRFYTTFSRHPEYDSLNFQTSWTRPKHACRLRAHFHNSSLC